ncbi:hypothetical protein CYMTET_16756 [Cymbomonas tetramitiformis]|uniref:Fungal lipase-type domain-containing protein n=1 Tax=Cymbomonas tetramitiformis TaxID=36881 RepID=A0AAE0GBK6_9CHLO|nr:hypothetical protein CYMTET_16756 [Cymbomonas tetramitiformis]
MLRDRAHCPPAKGIEGQLRAVRKPAVRSAGCRRPDHRKGWRSTLGVVCDSKTIKYSRAPDAPELQRAAQLARLSSGCYRNFQTIATDEGLLYVAEGTTQYTRWCIADEFDVQGNVTIRHILVRGVDWKDEKKVDRMQLWRKLAEFWPVPFERHSTPQDMPLVVHYGIKQVAEGVWKEVEPYLKSRPRSARISCSGHSLGGAVALLLMCFCRTRLLLPTRELLPTHAFGSPPVFALEPAGLNRIPFFGNNEVPRRRDDYSILGAFNLEESMARFFVLGKDVVPRCFQVVDPVWMFAKEQPVIDGLIKLRQRVLGGDALSDTRFLFHMHGLVYFMQWSADRGPEILVVDGATAAMVLQEGPSLGADVLASSPLLAIQSLMDHTSVNYAWELTIAARLLAPGDEAATHASEPMQSSGGNDAATN